MRFCDDLGILTVRSCNDLGILTVRLCNDLGILTVRSCYNSWILTVRFCDDLGILTTRLCDDLGILTVQSCDDLGIFVRAIVFSLLRRDLLYFSVTISSSDWVVRYLDEIFCLSPLRYLLMIGLSDIQTQSSIFLCDDLFLRLSRPVFWVLLSVRF